MIVFHQYHLTLLKIGPGQIKNYLSKNSWLWTTNQRSHRQTKLKRLNLWQESEVEVKDQHQRRTVLQSQKLRVST